MFKQIGRLCTGALAVAFLFPAVAQSTDTFRWNGKLANGQRVHVMDVNGSIAVTPSSGDAVSVVAEKKANRDGNLNDVEFKVEQSSEGLTICSLYRREDGSFPASCAERSDNNKRTKRNINVGTKINLQMPASANLKAQTVNGGIDVHGLRGSVDANTVNGAIDIETTGLANAKTVNGSVQAKVGTLNQDCTFSTVNGRVVVAVSPNLNATLSASTVNGKIESDLPITLQGSINRRNLQGKIGNGGANLKLSTVNGGIRLERASI